MTEAEQIQKLISENQKILIIQADNPDADSLASSLALEAILHELGKEPVMYCGVDMPAYLKYLPGWDRVENEVPRQFDASIIVDTSAQSLLQKLEDSGAVPIVASNPVIVLDHHADVPCDIPYASIVINDSTNVSTGELIYKLAKELSWPLPLAASEVIMTSILADSMGLVSDNTTADTYRVMAELVEQGVNRPLLEEQRRAFNKMHPSIFAYKGELIRRTEFHHDGAMALVVIPQGEINEYSPLYNPAPLIQADHLQTEGVRISVVLKVYDSGRVTAAIRCNHDAPIAGTLAETFGGGGHAHAAGFKLEGRQADDIKLQCIRTTGDLLDAAKKDAS